MNPITHLQLFANKLLQPSPSPMKASNKILLTEFRSKLKKIQSSHPSESVRFPEFMELLTLNYIRIYSKAEIGKLSKFFDNPLKLSRIAVPLMYLQLECVQECDKKKYFVVKVSATQVSTDLAEVKDRKHSVTLCLETFVKIMRKLYGSEKNWFKALGGLTVSVTIDPPSFKKSLAKVLRNTSHLNCTDQIVKLFLKESKGNEIEWKGFMKVVYEYNLLRAPVLDQKYNLTASSFASVQISKILFQCDERSNLLSDTKRKLSLSSNRNRTIQTAQSRASSFVKKPVKSTSNNREANQSVEFPRFFSLSAKPCVLYDKKVQFVSTFSTSFRANLLERKAETLRHHRKTRTQPNFFQQFRTSPKKQQLIFQSPIKTEPLEQKQHQKIEIQAIELERAQPISEIKQ